MPVSQPLTPLRPSCPGEAEPAGVRPCSAQTGRRWLTLLAALLAGSVAFVAGIAWAPQGATPADVRHGPQREAFLAGSERSVPILEDIAATLHQIDTRLARIEKLMESSAEKHD